MGEQRAGTVEMATIPVAATVFLQEWLMDYTGKKIIKTKTMFLIISVITHLSTENDQDSCL